MTTDNIDQTLAANSAVQNKRKRRSWVGVSALIAIVIALTCWFQLVHQQKKSTNNYSQLQSSFHQTLSDTAQLSQTINDLQNQLENQNSQIAALQGALNRLQANNSGYETDLALQQVDHYLLQANLSLNFNQDIPAAVNLLQAADQRLNSLSDPQIIPLRQAIAKSIVALQSIEPIDLIGLLSRLSALRDQVAHLPLFAINSKLQIFHAQPVTSSASTHLASLQSGWKKAWDATLTNFKSLVIIRNRQNEISPLISASQEEFLRQNLQLILQQAEWAVLQRQQAVYTYSLTQANEWIQRYFADNDRATLAMQADISQLQKINLLSQTPDISILINQLHILQLQINKSRTAEPDKAPVIVPSRTTIPTKEPPAVSNAPVAARTPEKGELV